ncbi:MAG: PspC domain-containing protein [Oryzihumus sp.]
MNESTGSAPVNALDKFFDGLRGLGVRRRAHDKWIGGVCSGIADRLGVDPVIVRAATVLLVLLGGVGVSAYLVAWLLLPETNGSIMAERALRHGEGSAVVLLVITGFAVFSGFPWWFGHNGFWSFPWGLLVLGGLLWWALSNREGRTPPAPPAQPAQPAAPGEQGTPPTGPTTTTSAMGAAPSAPAGAAWSTQVAERTAAWGQDAGERAAAWGQQVGSSFTPPARRRSGGALMTLVGIGLALVTYGLMTWLGDMFNLPGNHTVIALASALGALGVLVLGIGIAGWRAGFLGFLTVCLAVVVWAAAIFPSNLNVSTRVGDQTWRPQTISADSTFGIAVGDAVLDLTRLPATGLTGVSVPASVGVGQLTVIVPNDVTVAVDSHVGVGDITYPADGGVSKSSGSDVSKHAVIGTGPTALTIKAGVGFGEIKVVKE